MRAITVAPGNAGAARLDDIPEPATASDLLNVKALALGICGTDREILAGRHGTPPTGRDRLVLGHESLGEVVEAPAGSGFVAGDRVVGIVRRPDPVPCPACAAGEWDMCRNGLYRERGIKGLDGFGAEYFALEPGFAVRVDRALGLRAVLLEPASIVAKAFDHIDRIGLRSRSYRPKTLLVTGAGPVGLLAALMGQQRGLDVHLFDRNAGGVKPALAKRLGATYHTGTLAELAGLSADIIVECTGAAPVIADLIAAEAPGGPGSILCLAGVSAAGRPASLDVGAINRRLVLGNGVVFGTVNANRAHYRAALAALLRAEPAFLDGLITRRVPLPRFADALERQPGDVKVVIDFAADRTHDPAH